MRSVAFVLLLSCPNVGCHHFSGRQPCGPAAPACDAEAGAVAAPAPKIEVQAPETIVVKAPPQRIVIEQPPAACQQGPGFGSAPGGQHGPGYGAAPGGPQYGQPTATYGAAAWNTAPQMQFGAGPALMGGEVKDRTAVGLMFDTIKIPIPWIRLKAIPQPAEVTFKSQLAPGGFGSPVVMQTAGFGGVAVAPQAAFGAAPAMPPVAFGGVPTMPQPGFGAVGAQPVYTGMQYVPMQGTMPVQVPVAGAAAAGGFGAVPAAPPAGGGAGFGAAPPADDHGAEIEKLRQKLKECEELQNKVKALQAK